MKRYFLICAAGLLLFAAGCATNSAGNRNTSTLNYSKVDGKDMGVTLKERPYEAITADSLR